jgi:hypothetical protein
METKNNCVVTSFQYEYILNINSLKNGAIINYTIMRR